VYTPPIRAGFWYDSLIIESGDAGPARYRLAEIRRIDIVQPEPSRATPVWIGLGTGALAGALLFFAGAHDHCSSEFCIGRAESAVLGGLLGAGVGGLVAIPFVEPAEY
jgi:hypothetical protein